jgi:hypothetical protein
VTSLSPNSDKMSKLPEEEKPKIDAEIAELTEDLLEGEEERLGA